MNSAEARECYRVGDLFVDVGAMQVSRTDKVLHLPPLSFDLLTILVRRAPDVVSQEELLDTAWRGVVVGQETIKQRIKLLREALDDSPADPVYIATVRGRGYRLVAEVRRVRPRAGGAGRLRSRLRAILSRAPWNGPAGFLLAGALLLADPTTGLPGAAAAAARPVPDPGTGACGVCRLTSDADTRENLACPRAVSRAPRLDTGNPWHARPGARGGEAL